MKERPIPFSAPMVNAILAGTKTQTRRIVKPPRGYHAPDAMRHWTDINRDENGTPVWLVRGAGGAFKWMPCPYGQPGDRLWVKEQHCFLDVVKSHISGMDLGPQNDHARAPDTWNLTIEYSDGTERGTSVEGVRPKQTRERGDTTWRSLRFMPRWASRITLEVTGVRVERVQEISEADAIAEGLRAQVGDGGARGPGYKWNGIGYEGGSPGYYHVPDQQTGGCICKLAGPTPAQCAYGDLWDHINAKRAPWSSNPWVWVIEFKRVAP